MQYSRHAREQMLKRGFAAADIEAVITNPARGTNAPPARDAIEHFGYAADGRPMNVVTNRTRTLVITVTSE